MNDNLQQLRDLITRIVTGDGQQTENLTMTDDQHRGELGNADGVGDVDITIDIEDWLEMVEVARNNTDTYPPDESEPGLEPCPETEGDNGRDEGSD